MKQFLFIFCAIATLLLVSFIGAWPFVLLEFSVMVLLGAMFFGSFYILNKLNFVIKANLFFGSIPGLLLLPYLDLNKWIGNSNGTNDYINHLFCSYV